MTEFLAIKPDPKDYWRAIILFGKNVACYKLALGKALLELAPLGRSNISLEELAHSYSRHVVDHMRSSKAQSQFSKKPYPFLKACEEFILEQITEEQLVQITVKEGFKVVFEKFHNLNGELPIKFYEKNFKGITITDELFRLQETEDFQDLIHEVESRWKLVESSWDLGIPKHLLQVNYDPETELIFLGETRRRVKTTSSRSVLNGYQKGKCFYCCRDISIDAVNRGAARACEVDHFFPFSLTNYPVFDPRYSIDSIWNLVLSCSDCNREKSNKLPDLKFLKKLYTRNEYYINSNRPIGKTIERQTGLTPESRWNFLSRFYQKVKLLPNPSFNSNWKPAYEDEA